jgi:hypothetical protein
MNVNQSGRNCLARRRGDDRDATGTAAMSNASQPIGATHDRLSLAFEFPMIQLQAAYAATCHIQDKN